MREVRQLRDDGVVLLLERGTLVEASDVHHGCYRIRVLDGPYAGTVQWVPTAWVVNVEEDKPENPSEKP
ncbi:MAG: hypothetical protein KJO43_10305 [Phycisphaerae bacterium]|nr:hypothetical protein [Phycisphaerae bacterium]